MNKKKGIIEKGYNLKTDLNDFKVNKIFIDRLLNNLWNYPEAMYNLLLNSDDNIVKTDLASFIVNNFYCNHLSGNYMENNLLYVLTMMLKDEINKLNSIDQIDNFLENTKCGFLLEQLQKMPDIQIYFKNAIQNTVEEIENDCPFEIQFDTKEIEKELIKLKQYEEKRVGKKIEKKLDEFYNKIINIRTINKTKNNSREDDVKNRKEKYDLFIQKYIIDICINEIEGLYKNVEKQKNNDLNKYLEKLVNDIKFNNDIYSNKIFMKNMLSSKLSSHILLFYHNDFIKAISFLAQLLEDINNKIVLLPNSIKYICKIISILIKKKFKEITKIEENAFISKFLIEKLLIPIISFPSFNALINEYVVSGNTLKNIKTLNSILKKLFSGKLFKNILEESNYTPYNRFFIDKTENILLFFKKVVNVNLPDFIEKYINDELPEDYEYQYFNENKGQIYANISIAFTNNNLLNIIKGLENSSDFLQKNNERDKILLRCLEMLNTEKTIQLIKKINENKDESNNKNRDKDNNNDINVQNIYLYNSEAIEDKYKNLFLINNKVANFYIKIDFKKTQLNEEEKNIIKAKNYLCGSLGNYRLLDKSDFDIGTTSNTVKMLEQIKYYMSLPNFILNNNNIPSIWYINSILDCLKKIPEDYRDNEYKKLFQKLTINLNDSINELDFEILILFRNKLKFIDKMNGYYCGVEESMKDITINEEVKKIIEQIFIPVNFYFNYEENNKIFEITKSNIKEKTFEDKIIYEDPKKKYISLRTIEAFTRNFPDLSKYQILQGINPMDIIKELSINKKIDNYFNIIKEKIQSIKKGINKKNIDFYEEKIKDYVMNKIYDKIYPPEPDDKDNQIFKKSMHLSWIEPCSLVEKDYIYDNILPDILNEIKNINIVKTPYKKFICIKKIFQYIISLIKFNEVEKEDTDIGADDIAPILNYAFIKAHPFRIYSDIEFIKLFYGENEIYLNNIESVYLFIVESKAKDYNVSEEDYNKKCFDAAINESKQ